LIVDDLPQNYSNQINSAIPIFPFKYSPNTNLIDKELMELSAYLSILSKYDRIVEMNSTYFGLSNFENVNCPKKILKIALTQFYYK